MSNAKRIWTEEHKAGAASEGWELGLVVDEGKPVGAAYLDMFQLGGAFKDRRAVMTHVVNQARASSRLHLDALAACSSSRVDAAAHVQPTTKPRKKSHV